MNSKILSFLIVSLSYVQAANITYTRDLLLQFSYPSTPNCLTNMTGTSPTLDSKTRALMNNNTNVRTFGLASGYLCYFETFSDFYIYGDPHL